jgi:ABC-2 type transport system permease protein
MRFLPAGSVPWLLAHELKLVFRSGTRANRIGLAIAGTAMAALTAFAGFPLAYLLRDRVVTPSPIIVLWLDLALILLFTLLLSQTLASATLSLYERGDLDLLLSSPLPARRVLAVRAFVIATTPFLVLAALVTPFLLPFALLGHAAWLAAYLVLACLALTAASLGLMLAMALFAAIGPRRTRTIGQITAAFVGAGFFLISQIRNFFPHRVGPIFAQFQAFATSPILRADLPLAWPARAVLGEPAPLVAALTLSLLLFAVTAGMLGRRFAADAAIAAGVDISRKPRARAAAAGAFRGGVFRALVRKELKLLGRDPTLLSQVLLRVLYLIPVLFLLLRNAAGHLEGAVATGAGALAFVASQVAASLAWITISAEDAPDLLTAAPVERARVRTAKLFAALLPIYAVLLLPIAALAVLSPFAGFAALLGVSGASISAGLINLWYEKPAQRKNFRRRGTGSLASTLGELIIGLAWSMTTVSMASRSLWALVGLAVTSALLYAFFVGRNKD